MCSGHKCLRYKQPYLSNLEPGPSWLSFRNMGGKECRNLLLTVLLTSYSVCSWRNSDQFCMLLKQFRPILSAPKRILTNSVISWSNSNQFLSAPKGILTNYVCVWKNSYQLCLQLKKFLSIMSAPEGILTNSACSWRNSDQFCLRLKQFRPFLSVNEEIPTNSICSWRNFQLILSAPKGIPTNSVCSWRNSD